MSSIRFSVRSRYSRRDASTVRWRSSDRAWRRVGSTSAVPIARGNRGSARSWTAPTTRAQRLRDGGPRDHGAGARAPTPDGRPYVRQRSSHPVRRCSPLAIHALDASLVIHGPAIDVPGCRACGHITCTNAVQRAGSRCPEEVRAATPPNRSVKPITSRRASDSAVDLRGGRSRSHGRPSTSRMAVARSAAPARTA